RDALDGARLSGAVSQLPQTAYRNLLVGTDDGVVRITLDRPERRNALSLELMGELMQALRDCADQLNHRSVVIEGAGPAFSAGHDLGEMIGREEPFLRELFETCSAMMETIHELPQPVIANVHG